MSYDLEQAEARTRKQEAELDKSMDEVRALIEGLQEENGELRELLREMMYSPTRPPRLMARAEEALK
jgi:hypothetical protein